MQVHFPKKNGVLQFIDNVMYLWRFISLLFVALKLEFCPGDKPLGDD